MKAHVYHVSSVCCYYIHQLRQIRRSLRLGAAYSLVRAMVHSRLDYGNGILGNAPLCLVNSLQSVLRSAARLVLRLPPWTSVTQLMRDQLHWLPVQQRITFKLCTLAFKCIHGLGPACLSRLCLGVSTVPARSGLRSASSRHVLIPDTHVSTVRGRAFYYACPVAWNSLPKTLTANKSLSLVGYKKHLKTFLFR